MTLAAYLEKHGLTQAEFGRRVGMSRLVISRYARGIRFPRPSSIKAIQEATRGKVKFDDYLTREEAQS